MHTAQQPQAAKGVLQLLPVGDETVSGEERSSFGVSTTLATLIILPVILTLGLVHGVSRAGTFQVEPELPIEAAHSRGIATGQDSFAFAVTADMRAYAGPGIRDTPEYFRGAVEAIAELGNSDFMVSPGDLDPVHHVFWTITRTLGVTYTWYPVAGNHELPGDGSEPSYGFNLDWLQAHDYGAVNPGPTGCPTTTFSFDVENAHLVMLNEYCDSDGANATWGDVPDHLYNWLSDDLSSTNKTHIFVFGHEPAYPQPDADNGRERHMDDSLNHYEETRDRFWNLLRDSEVTAYICGHTHNYSAVKIDGVWQVDAGHARGKVDPGAPSTFLMVHVEGDGVMLKTYRDDAAGGAYSLRHTVILVDAPVAGLGATNDSPTALGSITTFTASISSASNVTYTWAFDDGAIGSGQVVSHTFETLGTHTATVTASGSLNELTRTASAIIGYPAYVPLVLGSQ